MCTTLNLSQPNKILKFIISLKDSESIPLSKPLNQKIMVRDANKCYVYIEQWSQ